MDNLRELLCIEKGVTAIIGAGGKTSLMKALSAKLMIFGTVILATSTRMYPFDGMPNLTNASQADVRNALKEQNRVCVGENAPEMKLSAPLLSFDALARLADYVLVEADGAKGKPVKAHRPTEPVIPLCAGQTILVAGISAIGQTIAQAAHCPEIYASICGLDMSDIIMPEIMARVINKENLHDRVFINQAYGDFSSARRIAALLDRPCVAGSLRKGIYKCLP